MQTTNNHKPAHQVRFKKKIRIDPHFFILENMFDFTLTIYKNLLTKLKQAEYKFYPFQEYLTIQTDILRQTQYHNSSAERDENKNVIILRHDVDRLPGNALQTAKIESDMGIKGTYYFRIVPESFVEQIIRQIADMGHEIGYHYEELDLVLKSQKSKVRSQNKKVDSKNDYLQLPTTNKQPPTALIDSAYKLFKVNLEKLRSVVPVTTICMHGSPLSKYDNKIIWSKYNYRNLDIIGEPYLDLNWDDVCYLTDTGRRWDGDNVSIRDRVLSRQSEISSKQGRNSDYNLSNKIKKSFQSTFDIINNIEYLPKTIMFTIHPERWTDSWYLWSKQLIIQSIKNPIKRLRLKLINYEFNFYETE